LPVLGFPHHVKTTYDLTNLAQPFTKEPVIVGNHHPNL
jgi:hypothetical protein